MRILLLILLLVWGAHTQGQKSNDFYKKAKELHDKGQSKEALIQIDNALNLDSLNIDFLDLKGGILLSLKEYQGSYDSYSKAIQIEPTNFYIYDHRGLMLQTIQQFDSAISDHSRALKFALNDTLRNTSLVNRAAAKIGIRDFTGAYADLILVYKKDSSDIGMLTNLAAICDEIGKGEETLKYLLRVIKLQPDFFPAYGNIGFKYQEIGNFKEAIKYYNKVLELKPNEPLGYSNRGYNKFKLGDYKGAHEDIEKSLELYPDNSYAYRIRALIYINENNKEKACLDLQKSIELGFTKMYGDEVINLQKKNCLK